LLKALILSRGISKILDTKWVWNWPNILKALKLWNFFGKTSPIFVYYISEI